MREAFPEDVRALLRDVVESYEQLETLLGMATRPGDVWDAAEVARRSRLPLDDAEEVLGKLAAAGLLQRTEGGGRYRYAPSDAAVAGVVERLAGLYATRPLEVVKVMSGNAIERLRTAAMRTFSDAFLLRRKPPGGSSGPSGQGGK